MIHLTWPGELPLVFAGLVTFVLHSSLWFLMAYLAARPAAGLGGAGQSRLWKLALVGPLISTALALGLPTGWRPTAFEVQLPAWGEREYVSRSGPALSLPVSGSERVGTGPAAPTWFHRGILFVVGSGLVGLGRLALYLGRRRRYLGRFRDRRWLTEGPAREELLGLVQAARFTRPVRLSVCEQAPSPLVLGSAEICLPERALRELEPPALTAALAHELGHVVRRDNLWLALAASFEALFFFSAVVSSGTPGHRGGRGAGL